MKKWTSIQYSRLLLFSVLVGLSVFVPGAAQTGAAENAAEPAVSPDTSVQKVDAARPAGEQGPVEYVSINVDGGSLVQVLNAFALQTGRNIVVGPNVVVTNGVNLHLNNVRWDEALDVILKPYGFGYRKVGDTLVVSSMREISALTAIEPLETKVFNLKYLDASDVQEIIKGQLSARGTSSVVAIQGQIGWDFSTMAEKDSDAAVSLGKLKRQGGANAKQGVGTQGKSKTLIVTDVPGSLARVTTMLDEVDKMQQQVLVEARLMEVDAAFVKDAGLDFKRMTFTLGGRAAGQSIDKGSLADPFGLGVNDFNAATYSVVGGAVAVINFLEQDDDTKVLSAPRILTLNNQEATIVVGQKFPIVKSEINNSTGGDNPTKTVQLDYYENSGIQLNVVPQICDDDYINMIVHPTVSTFVGFEVVLGQGEDLVRYPIIDVREAETQILLKTGETGVIGGLLQERKKGGIQKMPVLGSIPLIGRLFRNETADNQTIDLLIFLTATIVSPENRSAIIGENGKSGVVPPVTITVPAKEPVAVKAPEPARVSVAPEAQNTASAEQIMKELQK
jgi:type II secretory pathway component GspD/PulD (secretin)